ncbi:MAG: NAD(P)H-binding protein [Ferruginibacter sp.]
MTVTIFGATGSVGTQLVKEALLMGYKVRAFGRNVFVTDFPKNDDLELIQGGLFDAGDVRDAIKGSDAVLSAIGGTFDGADKSRSLGMKTIVEQMEKTNVKRIIAVGGMGVLADEQGKLLMDGEDYPAEYIPVGMEHLKAYQYLEKSPLDWTFVCAPDLVNADAGGKFLVASEKNPTGSLFKINTGDLALFMLKELNRNEHVKQRVGIGNI